ncbi:MAG: hypothetical protein KA179_07330, partial [Sulfuritalea sp.]|nr:hypothetical protein [Sulfuritalea sp.]
QQSGISLNPPPAAKRVRHHGHSQLSAGLLPFGFPGRPAAGCPNPSVEFLQSGPSLSYGFSCFASTKRPLVISRIRPFAADGRFAPKLTLSRTAPP